jgi:hypothetical protein
LKLDKDDEIGEDGAKYGGQGLSADGEEAHGIQLGDQTEAVNDGISIIIS